MSNNNLTNLQNEQQLPETNLHQQKPLNKQKQINLTITSVGKSMALCTKNIKF